ncbi:MAG: Fur family transcriptional regulator [Aequorivita sp.]
MKRRSTPTQDAVLAVLAEADEAMSQDVIEQKIGIEINRATIYRILNRFCEDGVLHRVVAEDGKQHFALGGKNEKEALAHNHFHFRCTKCKVVECLPFEVNYDLHEGYSVESVNCVLTGICNKCA